MAADIWMPVFIGDFLRDTARMTNDQRGAYMLLLIDYWCNGPLPDDDELLRTLCRCSEEAYAKLKPMLKLSLKSANGRLTNQRMDQEREKAEKRRNRAKAGGARLAEKKRSLSQAQAKLKHKPKQSLSECTIPLPSHKDISKDTSLINNTYDHEKKSTKPKKPKSRQYPDDFEEFWKQYPKRSGGNPKPGALKAWNAAINRGAIAADIIRGAAQYCEWCQASGSLGTSYVKMAQTFLGGDGWMDDWSPPAPENRQQNAFDESMRNYQQAIDDCQ